MKKESPDPIAARVDALLRLFPQCATEIRGKKGVSRRAVDLEKLRLLLGDAVAETPERYEFNWVGKRAAFNDVYAPTRMTLRPCPEESVDWDSTGNLYIEGDNLDALKLLQAEYRNKVKAIYVDPPYNTGSDAFLYADDFRVDCEEYARRSGRLAASGRGRSHEDETTDPRRHVDWCSMIFSRLILARELLTDDGLLGEQSVVALWDSLYHTIQTAIYAEAARWGDYRRDVHRWQTAGQLYTVDNHYMAERNRLLNQYFPVRTDRVLNSILSFVKIDDFEAPEGWVPLTASMFHQWDGSGADAQPLDTPVSVSWQMGYNVGGGEAIVGFVGVEENRYADLSNYQSLVLRGTGNGLRILANRLVSHGPWKQIVVAFNDSDPYWDADLQAIVVPLDNLRTMPDTNARTAINFH